VLSNRKSFWIVRLRLTSVSPMASSDLRYVGQSSFLAIKVFVLAKYLACGAARRRKCYEALCEEASCVATN